MKTIIENTSSERFIGNYNVTNCSHYEDNPLLMISKEDSIDAFNETLRIALLHKDNSYIVVLVGKKNDEKGGFTGNESPIGEITMAESERKWIIPLLIGMNGCESDVKLFNVEITKNDYQSDIDNRLSVSIWAKVKVIP